MATNFIMSSAISSFRREPTEMPGTASMETSKNCPANSLPGYKITKSEAAVLYTVPALKFLRGDKYL
jgi:hypothetical protein